MGGKISKTSLWNLWPPLIHCQVGITVGLLAIIQENSKFSEELLKYAITGLIGIFVSPICYFSFGKFGIPEIWKLNFENVTNLKLRWPVAEEREDRYNEFSDDLWWTISKPIVEKF